MILDELIQDFSKLSDVDLVARISEIRSRRIQAPVKTERAKEKKEKSQDESLLMLLQSLPEDELKTLLAGVAKK